MQKYWINVVSKERVMQAVEGGYMQSQDNEARLNRMDKDDFVIFYSSRQDAKGTIKLQFFTAVGKIEDDVIYPVEKSTNKIFRRKMCYMKGKEISLIPLIQKVSFIRNKKHWGSIFKMNLFQIPYEDFEMITKAMNVDTSLKSLNEDRKAI